MAIDPRLPEPQEPNHRPFGSDWARLVARLKDLFFEQDKWTRVSSRHALIAEGIATHNINASFLPITAIPFETIKKGAANWDATTNKYTAPEAGLYLINARCRAVEGQASGKGFSIDIAPNLYNLSWGVINNDPPFNRTTISLTRQISMKKGDSFQLLGYSDASGGVNVSYRLLEVSMIARD